MVIRLGERDEYTLRAPREEVICIDPAFNSVHSDAYPPQKIIVLRNAKGDSLFA